MPNWPHGGGRTGINRIIGFKIISQELRMNGHHIEANQGITLKAEYIGITERVPI